MHTGRFDTRRRSRANEIEPLNTTYAQQEGMPHGGQHPPHAGADPVPPPHHDSSLTQSRGGSKGLGSQLFLKKQASSFAYPDAEDSVQSHISLLLEDLLKYGSQVTVSAAEAMVLREAFLGLHYVWQMRMGCSAYRGSGGTH